MFPARQACAALSLEQGDCGASSPRLRGGTRREPYACLPVPEECVSTVGVLSMSLDQQVPSDQTLPRLSLVPTVKAITSSPTH
jgi:hypothetical protein